MGAVHHPGEASSALKVVPPVGVLGLLAANIPEVQLESLGLQGLDVEAECQGDGVDGFPIELPLKKYIFYLFIYLLEKGEGREKQREGNINVWLPLTCPRLGTWPVTQAGALTGIRTGDPLVHRLALNPLSHTSWGSLSNS